MCIAILPISRVAASRSTSPASGLAELAEPDREMLGRLGVMAYPRVNAGLDFGAWQHLLQLGCAAGADEILLANDSVFGPFHDLRPIFAAMRERGPDAWGMVASTEGVWHLQSWFVCLSAAALARPAVRRVFDQPFATMSKREIILHGELGLGVALQAEQLACAACFEEPRRRRLRRLAKINPMHLDWAWLITTGTVPFIKVELLRDNPIRIPWVSCWPSVVARVSDYPIEIVRDHLAAPRMNSPPSWRTLMLYLLLTHDKAVAWRASTRHLRTLHAKARTAPPPARRKP